MPIRSSFHSYTNFIVFFLLYIYFYLILNFSIFKKFSNVIIDFVIMNFVNSIFRNYEFPNNGLYKYKIQSRKYSEFHYHIVDYINNKILRSIIVD